MGNQESVPEPTADDKKFLDEAIKEARGHTQRTHARTQRTRRRRRAARRPLIRQKGAATAMRGLGHCRPAG
jgi:hypothetical protein